MELYFFMIQIYMLMTHQNVHPLAEAEECILLTGVILFIKKQALIKPKVNYIKNL